MIDKIKKYKNIIFVILSSVAVMIGVITQGVKDIEKEVVKIDSVIKTVDTTKVDTL